MKPFLILNRPWSRRVLGQSNSHEQHQVSLHATRYRLVCFRFIWTRISKLMSPVLENFSAIRFFIYFQTAFVAFVPCRCSSAVSQISFMHWITTNSRIPLNYCELYLYKTMHNVEFSFYLLEVIQWFILHVCSDSPMVVTWHRHVGKS